MLDLLALIALVLAVVRAWPLLKAPAPRRPRWWFALLVPLGCALGAAMAIAIDLPTQKMVAALCMPLGLVFLALLVVAVAHWKHSPKGSLVAGAFALILGLAGNVWVSDGLLMVVERGIPVVPVAEAGPFTAVCVLGGGTDTTPDGQAALGNSGDRVALAARLWHAGRTQYLVTSGMSIAGFTAPSDLGAHTSELWRGLGVPAAAIIHVPEGRITREEIAAYGRLIEARGWQGERIGVLSSAWHLNRALRLCRSQGISMDPVAADWRAGGPPRPFAAAWLVPNENAMFNTRLALWELLGMVVGR